MATWISATNFFLVLIFALFWITESEELYCKETEVKNVLYQKTRDGKYTAMDTTDWCQQDRPSYIQESGDNYLYYIETDDGWTGWMVGSFNCLNRGGIAAASDAARPEDVPKGSWEEVYDSSWYLNQKLVVECYSGGLSVGAAVGVVVAVIVVISILILIIVTCYCKGNKRQNGTVGVTRGARPQVRTRGHRNNTIHVSAINQPDAVYTNSDGVTQLPAGFVHMAEPPPYQAAYETTPPPPYSGHRAGRTNTAQVPTNPGPRSGHNTEVRTHSQSDVDRRDSMPPPYTPAVLNGNVFLNGAYEATPQ